MRETVNYKLPQIDTSDKFNIDDFNKAWLITDTELKNTRDEFDDKVNELELSKEDIEKVIDEVKEDYDDLRKVIIDDNISANLQEQINKTNSSLDNKTQQLETLKATKQEVDVERKRIDSFTSLSQGSTTGDAELIDGRVGANGVTYANIGSAIRTQIANIEDDKKQTINLFNINTITKGKQINSGGTLANNPSYDVSDIIAVIPNDVLYFYATNFTDFTTGYRIFFDFYDINKNWLSHLGGDNANMFTTVTYFNSKRIVVPSDAYYVRLQYSSTIVKSNNIMLTVNDVSTEYLPFKILNDYTTNKLTSKAYTKLYTSEFAETLTTENMLDRKKILENTVIQKSTLTTKGYFLNKSNDKCITGNIVMDKNTLYRLCFFNVSDVHDFTLNFKFLDSNGNFLGECSSSGDIWKYTDDFVTYKRFKIADMYSGDFNYVILQFSQSLLNYKISLVKESEYTKFYRQYNDLPYVREDRMMDYVDKKVLNPVTVSNGIALNSSYVNGVRCTIDDMNVLANGLSFEYEAGIYRSKVGGANYSHDSMLVSGADNKLYCVYVRNDNGLGDSPSFTDAYVELGVVDTVNFGTSSTITRYVIAKFGDTILGQNVISGVGVPNLSFVSSNILRILFSCKLADGIYYMFYRDLDITTNTLSEIKKCNMNVNGENLVFNIPNINSKITPLTNLDYFISMNAQISKNSDGYFYCGVCVGNQIKSSLIFRSLDLINFELWLKPSFTLNSDGVFEGACLCNNGYLYYALRQETVNGSGIYADNKMLLVKIRLSDKTIIDEYKIVDTGARACWLNDNGKIYLLHSICNRQRVEMILLNTDKIANSRIIFESALGCVYPSLIKLNNKYYLSSTGNSSTSVYIRQVSSICKYTISDVQNKLASLLRITDDLI